MSPPPRPPPPPPPPPPSQPAHAPRRQLYTPSPSPGRIIPTGANPPNRPPIQYGRRWGAGTIPSISAPAHIILHDAQPLAPAPISAPAAARSPLPRLPDHRSIGQLHARAPGQARAPRGREPAPRLRIHLLYMCTGMWRRADRRGLGMLSLVTRPRGAGQPACQISR